MCTNYNTQEGVITSHSLNIKFSDELDARMEIAWRHDLSYRSRADFIKRAIEEKLDRIDQDKNNQLQGMDRNPGNQVSCQK